MIRRVPEYCAFAPMAEADELCDLLFKWLEKRKKCAEKLLALAKELEDVHEASTAFQVVGSGASVLSLATAGVATLLTGGLATPLLVATTVGTIAGAAIDIGSTAIEAIVSGTTMKEAKDIIREDEKIGKDIQGLIEKLKCEVKQSSAHGSLDVGCEMATQIMGALARRYNVDVPLELLRTFTRSTFGLNQSDMHGSGAIPQRLIFAALTFVTVQLGIECFEKGLQASANGLGKSVAVSGAKAGAKAGFKVLGAIGFGVSLYSFISSCEEMVKSKQGTKASRTLRDVAREIQEARNDLKEQLDEMKENLKKISELKNLIKNLGKYSDNVTEVGQKIINYVIQFCTDEIVVSWLKTLPHQTAFLNLLCYFIERLSNLQERLKKRRGGQVDIVIVAHGKITNEFVPAGLLTPPPIIDTVLYSPWNCLINANAACAIAEGWNTTEGRYLFNKNNPYQSVHFEPNPLPDCWNHMRRPSYPIPWILLTPVYSEESAWKEFVSLQGHMEKGDRIIIPFIVPKISEVPAFGQIPFVVFNLALSYILMLVNKTATVHLAACLDRGQSELMPDHWKAQYAYTEDKAMMTAINRDFSQFWLLGAFRAMFGRNGR